jgi:hypothetical protein
VILVPGLALFSWGIFGSFKHSSLLIDEHKTQYKISESFCQPFSKFGVNIYMKLIATIIVTVLLTGCSSLISKIPSFWDDNQSARIIDVRLRAEAVNCSEPQLPQIRLLAQDLRWFELYSQSKGSRQTDVLKLIQPLQATVKEWEDRSSKQEGSKFYCETKKKIVTEQAKRAAEATLGRF